MSLLDIHVIYFKTKKCELTGYVLIHWVELENRLLSRFDAASQRRELSTMSECAKILSQVIFCIILFCLVECNHAKFFDNNTTYIGC